MPDYENLYQQQLASNRRRQKRYYDNHKAEITRRKREERGELRALRKEVANLRAGNDNAPCEECQNEPPSPNPPAVSQKRGNRRNTTQAPEIVEPDEPDEPEPEPAPVASNNKRKLKIVYTVGGIVNKFKELIPNEDTLKTHIRSIRKVFELTGCQYFEACITKFIKIKKDIETARQNNGKPYSINSILAYLNSIRVAYTLITDIAIPDNIKRQYDELCEIYKQKSKAQSKKKKEDMDLAVITTDEYLERIDNKFGEGTKEELIANLYMMCPARDNFSLTVVVNVIEANKDKTKNYIIVPRTKANCKIILNKYKTSNRYLDLTYDLDKDTSNMVRNWITEENIGYGATIFKEKKLSDFISKMHKKINIKGSINYLRHMIVSNQKIDEMSIEDLVKNATKMMHSPAMHRDYCRVLLAKS